MSHKTAIKTGVGFVLFILLLILQPIGCAYVEPGHVGIKVNLFGNQKGVEDFPLQTGRVFYNKYTQKVYEYPTYMQHRAWVVSDSKNESITFNSQEGAQIEADVGLNYSLKADEVPHMFIEFRQPIDVVSDTYLRNIVRDSFNRVAGNYKAVDIFGEQKQEMLDEVKKELQTKLDGRAFIIDSVSFIGSPRADTRVMQSINMVIEATQRAIEAENKVRQIEAEAKQKIAQADGEAQSILKVAQAQAEANKTLSESITPELIHYEMLRKWDGVAPKVMGSEPNILMQVE